MAVFPGRRQWRRMLCATLASLLLAVAGTAETIAASAIADDSIAAASAPPDETMQSRVRVCTGCHGEQGRAGPDGYYPRLAGKPAEYLFLQLRAFRDDERRYRPMERLLRGLPDAYLRDFARYFAALEVPYPPPPAMQVDAATLARGRALAHAARPAANQATGMPACIDCHGEDLLGDEARVPELTGLSRDYLNAQLGAWRTGQRRTAGSGCMARVVEGLAPTDIAALSTWIASRAPAHGEGRKAVASKRPVDVAQLRETIARHCPSPAAATRGTVVDLSDPVLERGRYVARLGHCEGCHTRAGEPRYSGGPALDTGFGIFHAPNLTPDPVNGIGKWSADDFYLAMHEGRSRDGRPLYPAFPYLWYTRITRADSDALYAWLRNLPASTRARTPHELPFPMNLRPALALWRALWFTPHRVATTPVSDTAVERGAYLGEGLGHCGACHTGRNRFGAPSTEPSLNGASMPGNSADERWHVPSLRDPAQGAVTNWPTGAIAQWLRTGTDPRAVASGPMGEVVHGSLQYLHESDAQDLAVWLRSLGAARGDTLARRSPNPVTTASMAAGSRIYEAHCADCHGVDGRGSGNGEHPALAANRQVVSDDPRNLVAILRHGGFAPATASQPRPAGMPPYATALDPREMASVLDYIRNSWGNSAPALRAGDFD